MNRFAEAIAVFYWTLQVFFTALDQHPVLVLGENRIDHGEIKTAKFLFLVEQSQFLTNITILN